MFIHTANDSTLKGEEVKRRKKGKKWDEMGGGYILDMYAEGGFTIEMLESVTDNVLIKSKTEAAFHQYLVFISVKHFSYVCTQKIL